MKRLSLLKYVMIALMLVVCSVAMSQTESKYYMNVQTELGKVQSYEVNPNLKVSWEKTMRGVTPSEYYNKDEVDEKLKEIEDRSWDKHRAIEEEIYYYYKRLEEVDEILKNLEDSLAKAELTLSGYYNKNEVDEKIKALEEKNKNLEDRLARAERLISTIINNGNFGHEYVELAGYKWATENVGEVSGLTALYSDSKYVYLYSQNDALQAARSWGGIWTLPTMKQWQALIDNCYWVWVSEYNGQNGFMVYEAQTEDDKGKHVGSDSELSEAYTSTVPHIFLPATGVYDVDQGRVDYQHSDGYYRSADGGHYLGFNDYILSVSDYYLPADGIAVRLVSE